MSSFCNSSLTIVCLSRVEASHFLLDWLDSEFNVQTMHCCLGIHAAHISMIPGEYIHIPSQQCDQLFGFFHDQSGSQGYLLSIIELIQWMLLERFRNANFVIGHFAGFDL